MRATAWSLDEFAVADGFGEFTPAETRIPAQSADDREADFEARLAVERSRAEAAVPHPIDPIRLGEAVVGLMRTPAG